MSSLLSSRGLACLQSKFSSSHLSSIVPVSVSVSIRHFHNPRYLKGVGPMCRRKSFRHHPRSQGAIALENKKIAEFVERKPIVTPVRPLALASPQAWVYNMTSLTQPKSLIDLNPHVFSADTSRIDLIHRTVIWQRAKARGGNHKTKNVSEVRGTGKKPFAQKGTGSARQGSLVGPHMKGGGRAHPLRVRDYSYHLPIKVRRLAMRVMLSVKYKEGSLMIIDEAKLPTYKTGTLSDTLNNARMKNVLLIHGNDENDGNLQLAVRNLWEMNIIPSRGANVLSILKAKHVIISKAALQDLDARLADRTQHIHWNVGSQGVARPIRLSRKQLRTYSVRGQWIKRLLKEKGLQLSTKANKSLPSHTTQEPVPIQADSTQKAASY